MDLKDITIVTREEIKTAGVKIRTSMASAKTDCPALWAISFAPHMPDFPADPKYPDESYGASVMIEEDVFDYWAVMPLAPDTPTPEGMETLTLNAGLYVMLPVPNLEQLTSGYNLIYQSFFQKNPQYAMDLSRPCYELYGLEFQQNGALTLYCPVMKK